MVQKIILALTLVLAMSGNFAFAQEVYWKKQDVTVQVTSQSGKDFSYNQIFHRMVLTHNYYECGYYQEPEVVIRPGTCYEVICQGGAGRSPAWDAFYSARKEEKATKLAAAIKGVGKASAESLVQANYFYSKPRSWEAFKAEINRAAQSGVITQQVKALVLSTYRNDNISNLGYASGSCTYTPYACDEVVVIREGQYVSRTCDDPRETVIDSKQMNYSIRVDNSVLLPSEVEKLNLSLSGQASESNLKSSIYNNYSLQIVGQNESSTQLILSGVSRRLVNLPSDSLLSVALVPQGAQLANLQISVSPGALPANNTEQLAVSFEVRTCNIGLLGLCGFSWDKKQTFNGFINNGMVSFKAPTGLPVSSRGVKMEVQVKIYKMNSMYHNAQPVVKTTRTIKLK